MPWADGTDCSPGKVGADWERAAMSANFKKGFMLKIVKMDFNQSRSRRGDCSVPCFFECLPSRQ